MIKHSQTFTDVNRIITDHHRMITDHHRIITDHIQKWGFQATKIYCTVIQIYTPQPLGLWGRRVLIMVAHYGSSYPMKQTHPCVWHTHHLALHGIRKVLNLHPGNSMCQSNKVHVNSLEGSSASTPMISSPLLLRR